MTEREMFERLCQAAEFEPCEGELLQVRHLATRQRFVSVPGGETTLGWSAEDVAAVSETLRLEGSPIEDLLRTSVRRNPPRDVRVEPFFCARHPWIDRAVAASRRGRSLDVDVRDMFPDVEAWDDARLEDCDPERLSELRDEFGDDIPDWAEEELLFSAPHAEPALFTADEARVLLDQWPSLRALTIDEWEWLARAGGAQRFVGDPGIESSHPFGVWGLAFGTWAQAPDGELRVRGEAWRGYPYQDAAEQIVLHPAFDLLPRGDERCALLLAIKEEVSA